MYHPDLSLYPGRGPSTVYGLAQKGTCLLSRSVGGQWRFRRGAIDSWIEEKTRAAGAQTAKNGAEPSNPRKED